MLLTEHEVQKAIEQVKTVFPSFTDWEYNNKIDGEYFGFSLWGQFVLNPNPEDQMPRRFFITFDAYEENWYGHLTIGQPYYLWSSADVGDAYLIDIGPCKILEEAMEALRIEIRNLFRAFSAELPP